MIDDAPDFDAMMSMDDGPPVGYDIGGQDAATLFGEVIAFYKHHWFNLTLDERFA